jgi:hypothetical protein
MAGVAAAVDRASARTFYFLFGVWPGDESEKKEDQEEE